MNTIPQKAPWSDKEVATLKKTYADINNAELTLFIDRTEFAIEHKARKLGLKKSEKFLNSHKSGRFTAKVSLFKRLKKVLWKW